MDKNASGPGTCQGCGQQTTVAQGIQEKQTGMLLARRTVEHDGLFCQPCMAQLKSEVLKHNLTKSWWSIRGIVFTPMLLALNKRRFKQHTNKFVSAPVAA